LSLFTCLVYAFLYAPIVVLVVLSFNNSRFSTIWRGFTWHWYALAFRDAELTALIKLYPRSNEAVLAKRELEK